MTGGCSSDAGVSCFRACFAFFSAVNLSTSSAVWPLTTFRSVAELLMVVFVYCCIFVIEPNYCALLIEAEAKSKIRSICLGGKTPGKYSSYSHLISSRNYQMTLNSFSASDLRRSPERTISLSDTFSIDHGN